MNITYVQLIQCIESSIDEVDVCIKDDDYYAKRDSYTISRIDIINPHKLIENLMQAEQYMANRE